MYRGKIIISMGFGTIGSFKFPPRLLDRRLLYYYKSSLTLKLNQGNNSHLKSSL